MLISQTPATGLEKFEKEPVVAPRRQSLDQMLGLSSGDASRHSTESKWESPPFDEEWKLVSSSGGAGITADGVRPPVWTLAAGTGVVQDSRRPSFVRYTSPRKFVVNARDAEEAPLQAEPRRNSREVGCRNLRFLWSGSVLFGLDMLFVLRLMSRRWLPGIGNGLRNAKASIQFMFRASELRSQKPGRRTVPVDYCAP